MEDGACDHGLVLCSILEWARDMLGPANSDGNFMPVLILVAAALGVLLSTGIIIIALARASMWLMAPKAVSTQSSAATGGRRLKNVKLRRNHGRRKGTSKPKAQQPDIVENGPTVADIPPSSAASDEGDSQGRGPGLADQGVDEGRVPEVDCSAENRTSLEMVPEEQRQVIVGAPETEGAKEGTGMTSDVAEPSGAREVDAESDEDEAGSLAAELEAVYVAERMEQLPQEVESGHVEYKLHLAPETDERFQQLVSQMQFRLSEGMGEALYEIGVQDDGCPVGLPTHLLHSSVEVLSRMAHELGASISVLRVRDGSGQQNSDAQTCDFQANSGEGEVGESLRKGCLRGRVAEVLVRRLSDGDEFFELRVAVVGNVDSGKSTLLGVLSRGQLDNGRGRARLNLFRHKHEVESGRTSDIGRELIGFDSRGRIVNYSSVRTPTWSEICAEAAKIVVFMDLAGHEKYLRTTVFGLTGNFPDYTMLLVGANMGVVGMTKEHFHLTLALKVPSFVVVTKIDIAPQNVLEETMRILTKMVKSPGSKKIPLIVKTQDDVMVAARNISSGRIAPIFLVSNVTGESLDLLRSFLNLISARTDWEDKAKMPAKMHIDNTFSVPGVGTVVSGTLVSGSISMNETLMFGPNGLGQFQPVTIKGIHTSRLPVKNARAGQSLSVALKKIKRSQCRKGQVILSSELHPHAAWEFDAEIFVITHSTTIGNKYEAVVHCGCARQTAQIVGLDGVLRSGVSATVRFRFKYRPEYIEIGGRLIFREGKTKGIGNIIRVIHDPAEELGQPHTT